MIDRKIRTACTGCNMCGDLCPKGAITYSEDQEGFAFPAVDYGRCVECGLCVKHCPVLTEKDFSKNLPEVYAAWSRDDQIRLESTSGGIYYELARKMIEGGGYIVGAVFSHDFKSVHHMVGHDLSDLKRIMGSKYFQSNADGIYGETRKLLEAGEKVLFCGTPCQCAALQSFLGVPYDNLYLVDFICRGINSPLAFRKHMEELEEQYDSNVSFVHLKNKKTGWQSLATYVEFENGAACHQDKTKSAWVRGFVGGDGLYTRKSCYECKFRTLPRISDITIGDFWGIKNQKKEDLFKGISAVMVNTQKGKGLLEAISSRISLERRNFDELDAGNPALRVSPQYSEGRERFFSVLNHNKFSIAVEQCSKSEKPGWIRYIRGIAVLPLRMLRKLRFYRRISFLQYVKYNYFSKNIVREKNVRLIPYKNAVIDLSKDSRIYIKGRNLEIGINQLKGAKTETHIRMNGNAKWYVNNGCGLFYNTVLEVKDHAVLESGYFTANGGSVIICAKHIKLGEDVMLGRNVIIYDSDHHQVFDEHYEMCNPAKDVIIEDHVWLTTDITILKGVTIGRDSLVTAMTLIRKDIPAHSLVSGGSTGKVVGECKGWSRKSTYTS